MDEVVWRILLAIAFILVLVGYNLYEHYVASPQFAARCAIEKAQVISALKAAALKQMNGDEASKSQNSACTLCVSGHERVIRYAITRTNAGFLHRYALRTVSGVGLYLDWGKWDVLHIACLLGVDASKLSCAYGPDDGNWPPFVTAVSTDDSCVGKSKKKRIRKQEWKIAGKAQCVYYAEFVLNPMAQETFVMRAITIPNDVERKRLGMEASVLEKSIPFRSLFQPISTRR